MTVQSAYLKNTSHNHAYFKVCITYKTYVKDKTAIQKRQFVGNLWSNYVQFLITFIIAWLPEVCLIASF